MLYLFLILGSICCALVVLLFFKQKSAYEMRISDWSSDVCSSDLEMPDPDMARRAVEMAIGTIFDVLKDTRMEEFAQQLAWGMVNSFHMTARLAEGREDDAAKKLGEMARHFDPSEIYAVEQIGSATCRERG